MANELPEWKIAPMDACCRKCEDKRNPSPLHRKFVVCSTCGNKRCPKATDHDLACTNSNDSGQKGSVYE